MSVCTPGEATPTITSSPSSYIWVLHDVLGFAYIIFIASVFTEMDIVPWVCVCVCLCACAFMYVIIVCVYMCVGVLLVCTCVVYVCRGMSCPKWLLLLLSLPSTSVPCAPVGCVMSV